MYIIHKILSCILVIFLFRGSAQNEAYREEHLREYIRRIMPKLNKFLATSIITDIKECVLVANEIYSWVGDIEHLSWKFPAKTAKDINAMEVVKEHNGTAGEFYILLLELAYDRVQFALRLMVEFMDKYPSVDGFFKEVACIKRSNQISLASLLRLVWDRLKTNPESISRHMVKNREDDETQDYFTRKVSRSSQAESTVNYCESCTIAGEAVLQVITAIERVFLDSELISVAVTERDKIRNNVYESTQWAVMSRLTRGIETDVGTALARMRESNLKTEAARKVDEETIRNLRASLSRQEERSDAFQAKNSELDDALENVKEELEKTNQAKVIKEREYEQLKNTLESTRRIVAVLTTGNNILQSQTGTLAESKLELERTVIRLRKEVIETRDAYLETERHVRTLLDETRQKNNSMKDEHRREIEKLQLEMELLRIGIANQKDDMVLKNMDESNSLKGFRKEGIDPIADMTRQLDTNREKIEVLTRQNERLSKTLKRLKDYHLSGQTVSSGQKK